MKLTLPFSRLVKIILIANISVGVILFLCCINLFIFQTWSWIQWMVIAVYIIFCILISVLTPFNLYYEINKKYVEEVKFTKRLVYNFSDIIYINEERSEKKKKVCFYTRFGHVRELYFDKQNIIYKSMLANCKNLMSKEDFERRYPNVRW